MPELNSGEGLEETVQIVLKGSTYKIFLGTLLSDLSCEAFKIYMTAFYYSNGHEITITDEIERVVGLEKERFEAGLKELEDKDVLWLDPSVPVQYMINKEYL